VSSTSHQIGAILDDPRYSPEDVADANYDMELATVRLPISPLKISGGTQAAQKLSSGMYRSPPQLASPTIGNSSSLAGARFYIDPGLGRDFQLEVKDDHKSVMTSPNFSS
jgi:hypothetical protein